MDLSDAQLAQLDSIEQRLLQLAEDLLLEEIDETSYAFGVHDRCSLQSSAAPAPPAHVLVMKRCDDGGGVERDRGLTLAQRGPDLGRPLCPCQTKPGGSF